MSFTDSFDPFFYLDHENSLDNQYCEYVSSFPTSNIYIHQDSSNEELTTLQSPSSECCACVSEGIANFGLSDAELFDCMVKT